MLKKIYIDNYKCYSNFELSFEHLNLLLGPNGAGKSSLFEVLGKLQLFLGGVKADLVFSSADLTRWTKLRTQRFEAEISGNGGVYRYELSIQFDEDFSKNPIVEYERLWFEQILLLRFESGNVHLSRGDSTSDVAYPLEQLQSAIALLPIRKETEQIHWFRRYISHIIVVQVNPSLMDSISEREEPHLSWNSRNFVAWYRFVSNNQGVTIQITQELQRVLEGFSHFVFVQFGEQRQGLIAKFVSHNGKHDEVDFALQQLSDGQRSLIALYTLIYFAASSGYLLCIDEPENFLALPEIQPWLIKLYDFCMEGAFQGLLISHHPELINYLAASQGIWLERTASGPVRAKPIVTDLENGLSISELIARGWLHV
jgi:predicted ATPase